MQASARAVTTSSLEGLKWMAAYAANTSYFLPTHLERAGPFNPDGNNGFNIEHLRNFNNAAPNTAFGFETQPGHGASSDRGEYAGRSQQHQRRDDGLRRRHDLRRYRRLRRRCSAACGTRCSAKAATTGSSRAPTGTTAAASARMTVARRRTSCRANTSARTSMVRNGSDKLRPQSDRRRHAHG